MNYQVYQDTESLQEFAVLVEMYRALAPYTEATLGEIASQGLPVQRPLFLHYEDDARTWDVAYEYMYGRDLLVAPVLQSGVSTQEVYLPGTAELWTHFFTGKQYKGGNTVTVEAPVGYPPVFYRRDSKFIEVFEKVIDIRMEKNDAAKPLDADSDSSSRTEL